MLTGGDKATEHLGIININRGGNYKISYDAEEFNDTGIRGFSPTTALILRRNMVVVPIHFYILSVALGICFLSLSLVAKRQWQRTARPAHEIFPAREDGFVTISN
jgi:hypothetical protein